ncbi:hypothetical protein [Dongia deserti]|uniref:hypothetical protein n=1 Tax=Dongia deserti TaxID=2268030 RepID=UPI000E64AA76|nr:hypothetical protein [Dongia deserti]
MSEIRGSEKVSAKLGRFSPSAFKIVEKLAFFAADVESTRYDLDIVLLTDKSTMQYRVSIRFENVIGLKVKDFGGGLTQVMGLYIQDISEKGWDRQNWEIGDFEHSVISFRCRDLYISSCEAV